MTNPKAFFCPHGVDVTPQIKTTYADGEQKSIYEQTECLHCTADMGNVVLFMPRNFLEDLEAAGAGGMK